MIENNNKLTGYTVEVSEFENYNLLNFSVRVLGYNSTLSYRVIDKLIDKNSNHFSREFVGECVLIYKDGVIINRTQFIETKFIDTEKPEKLPKYNNLLTLDIETKQIVNAETGITSTIPVCIAIYDGTTSKIF